jgi:AraC-like DNA-binding protein
VDPGRILERIGVSRATLADVHAWVPVDAMARAWMLVSEEARDPDFGLHAAETVPIGVYGVLEFATMSSRNILETLERVARYYRLMGAMSQMGLDVGRTGGRVTMHPVLSIDPARLRHYHEYTFAFLVTRGRMLVGEGLRPSEVRFRHAQPASISEHVRVFGARVRFGQPSNELLIPRAVLDMPLRTANPSLSATLEASGQTMLGQQEVDFAAQVRLAARAALLEAGDARLDVVARRLNLGARTLQRRLGDRKTTYARVLDDVRRETAEGWLAQGSMSFGEIAFALGFSEPSAFHRAFKRWTGRTPRAYQKTRRR